MNVTHQDVIDYIEEMDSNHKYIIHDGKLYITGFLSFCNFKYSTLPSGMVFECACDLDNSGIKYLPDDIVLKSHLYMDNTKNITIPAIYISGVLYSIDSDIKLNDGIYIGSYMYTSGSRYEHLEDLYIKGYLFSTGILS